MMYFDNASTQKPLPCALRAYRKALKHYGNPHSSHICGRKSAEILEQAKKTIASCINCSPDEVYFTSGATESCNWAIHIMEKHTNDIESDGREHSSVYEAINDYYRTHTVQRENEERTGYVFTLVNSETGRTDRPPVKKPKNMLVFCDATAAVGNIHVDFNKLDVDYMAFDAHKFGGLCGIGCLIVKAGAPVEPMILGGSYPRSGTPPVALASAMAAALDHRTKTEKRRNRKILAMRKYLEHALSQSIPETLFIRGLLPVVPNILSVTFSGIRASTLVAMMSDAHGTMISAGAACDSGNDEPSRVLLSTLYTESAARSTVRISLSEDNTMRQCRKLVKQLAKCVEHLRKF